MVFTAVYPLWATRGEPGGAARRWVNYHKNFQIFPQREEGTPTTPGVDLGEWENGHLTYTRPDGSECIVPFGDRTRMALGIMLAWEGAPSADLTRQMASTLSGSVPPERLREIFRAAEENAVSFTFIPRTYTPEPSGR
jgi:hypothetical protein